MTAPGKHVVNEGENYADPALAYRNSDPSDHSRHAIAVTKAPETLWGPPVNPAGLYLSVDAISFGT